MRHLRKVDIPCGRRSSVPAVWWWCWWEVMKEDFKWGVSDFLQVKRVSTHLLSIQFHLSLLSLFYNQQSLLYRSPESDQATVARKNFLLAERNLEQGQAHMRGQLDKRGEELEKGHEEKPEKGGFIINTNTWINYSLSWRCRTTPEKVRWSHECIWMFNVLCLWFCLTCGMKLRKKVLMIKSCEVWLSPMGEMRGKEEWKLFSTSHEQTSQLQMWVGM